MFLQSSSNERISYELIHHIKKFESANLFISILDTYCRNFIEKHGKMANREPMEEQGHCKGTSKALLKFVLSVASWCKEVCSYGMSNKF